MQKLFDSNSKFGIKGKLNIQIRFFVEFKLYTIIAVSLVLAPAHVLDKKQKFLFFGIIDSIFLYNKLVILFCDLVFLCFFGHVGFFVLFSFFCSCFTSWVWQNELKYHHKIFQFYSNSYLTNGVFVMHGIPYSWHVNSYYFYLFNTFLTTCNHQCHYTCSHHMQTMFPL
jgi:hypothetical protein